MKNVDSGGTSSTHTTDRTMRRGAAVEERRVSPEKLGDFEDHVCIWGRAPPHKLRDRQSGNNHIGAEDGSKHIPT